MESHDNQILQSLLIGDEDQVTDLPLAGKLLLLRWVSRAIATHVGDLAVAFTGFTTATGEAAYDVRPVLPAASSTEAPTVETAVPILGNYLGRPRNPLTRTGAVEDVQTPEGSG
jgi:hypothetical protein